MVSETQSEISKPDENEVAKGSGETNKKEEEEEQEPERLLVTGLNKTVSQKKLTRGPPTYKYITREEWGAVSPTRLNPFRGPARSVRLVFTDSLPCRSKKSCIKVIKKLQRIHMRQGLSDIAYNFLIGGDIRIYEGRGWTEHPGVTEGTENYRTCEDIVVAYVGSFEDNIEYPEMADRAHEVIDYGFNAGLMTGEWTSLGGQAPPEMFSQPGVDIPGCPEETYKSTF